ncbi:MAG: hypothetical protein C0483_13950 [Pirellula sp.]|nr:hypothetical protein [Pirellula sp.]
MNNQEALLQEFASRKEQVLNLEMRQFVLVIALELLFVIAYAFFNERVWQSRVFAFAVGSAYLVLFFELIAINGKMGLVSMYLRQLEDHLTQLGQVGVVWESRALDAIVFRPGNAFMLPASITVGLLILQTLFVVYCQLFHLSTSQTVRYIALAFIAVGLLYLLAKTSSVDFKKPLPQVFRA